MNKISGVILTMLILSSVPTQAIGLSALCQKYGQSVLTCLGLAACAALTYDCHKHTAPALEQLESERKEIGAELGTLYSKRSLTRNERALEKKLLKSWHENHGKISYHAYKPVQVAVFSTFIVAAINLYYSYFR